MTENTSAATEDLSTPYIVFIHPESILISERSSQIDYFNQLNLNNYKSLSKKFNYGSNTVKTTRYTRFNFIPLNIYYQFKNFYNLYFLIAAILSLIPAIRPLNVFTSVIPILSIVLIDLIKDGYQDYKRYLNDKKVNDQSFNLFRNGKFIKDVPCNEIRVGDLVRFDLNEKCPVDMILLFMSPLDGVGKGKKRRRKKKEENKIGDTNVSLSSPTSASQMLVTQSFHDDDDQSYNHTESRDIGSDGNNEDGEDGGRQSIVSNQITRSSLLETHSSSFCYIETSDLDGESSLKRRDIPIQLLDMIKSSSECHQLVGRIDCEPPNDHLYDFSGRLLVQTSISRPSNVQAIPLSYQHFLPRSCVLKSASYVIGVAIYIGSNTKIYRNQGRFKPTKTSSFMHSLNGLSLGIMFLDFLILALSALFGGLFLRDTGQYSSYLFPNSQISSNPSTITSASLIQVGSSFILYTFLLPISLFVSIELLRVIHQKFIYWDNRMKYLTPKDQLIIDSQSNPTDENEVSSGSFSSYDPCIVRNINLHEDLAKVTFVFSDKTGTLTKNKMKVNEWYLHRSLSSNPKNDIIDHSERTSSPHSNMNQTISSISSFSPDDLRGEIILEQSKDPQSLLHYMRREDLIRDGLDRNNVRRYILTLALCHTILPVIDPETNNIDFEGESSDEIAILKALHENEIILEARSKEQMLLSLFGTKIISQLFYLLEFSSERKRVSLLTRTEDRIILFSKGADQVILKAATNSPDETEPSLSVYREMDIVAYMINEMSRRGLRVIVVASKILSENKLDDFSRLYDQAVQSIERREKNITYAFDQLEHSMNIHGAVGIEDELAEGVPSCIKLLEGAGIKLWILTGDKVETAVHIAKTCGILHAEELVPTSLQYLVGEAVELSYVSDQLRKILKFWQVDSSRSSRKSKTLLHILIVDGVALEFLIFSNYEIFLKLILQCDVVIGCRVTPLQKTLLVRLVKKNTPFVSLAIGDGTNDVGMIQMASIGVGLTTSPTMTATRDANANEDNENKNKQLISQASRASDYSLSKFTFIAPLLFIHGRYSLLRYSKLAQSSIYRNTTLVLTQFWFGIFSGFSAQTLYNSYFLLLYNVVFTSVTPFLVATFEKDILEEDLLKYPSLYKDVRNGSLFNRSIMLRLFFFALYDSLIIFFSFYILTTEIDMSNTNGLLGGFPVMQDFMSTMIFLVVTMRPMLYTGHWVIWIFFGHLFSVSLFIVNLFAFQASDYGQFYAGCRYLYYIILFLAVLYQLPIYYFATALVVVACLLPEVLIEYYRRQYYPPDDQILKEMRKAKKSPTSDDHHFLSPSPTATVSPTTIS